LLGGTFPRAVGEFDWMCFWTGIGELVKSAPSARNPVVDEEKMRPEN